MKNKTNIDSTLFNVGVAQDDDFLDIKNLKNQQLKYMPLSLESETNNNYPASDEIFKVKQELLHKYAPNKM